jgi:hypothetical protein
MRWLFAVEDARFFSEVLLLSMLALCHGVAATQLGPIELGEATPAPVNGLMLSGVERTQIRIGSGFGPCQRSAYQNMRSEEACTIHDRVIGIETLMQQSALEKLKEGPPFRSPSVAAAGVPLIATNAALRDVTSANYAYVFRNAFTEPEDNGAQLYRSQNSPCLDPDDGAQVTSADGNCWVAAFGTEANAGVWGLRPSYNPGNVGNACAGGSGSDSSRTFNRAWSAAKRLGITLIIPDGGTTLGYRLDDPFNLTSNNDPVFWNSNRRPMQLRVEGTIYSCGTNAAIYIKGDNLLGIKLTLAAIIGPGAGISAPRAGSYKENVGIYLDGASGFDISVGSITDFTYDLLFDGAYANRLTVGEALASYKAMYLRAGASGTTCVDCLANANEIRFSNVGGPYTFNGDPQFLTRQARSSYWGVHIANGVGNKLIGGTLQYATKGHAPVNLQIDDDDNLVDAYIEGQTGTLGQNCVIGGNGNVLHLSSLATPSSNATKNCTITGTGNQLIGPFFSMADPGLIGGTSAPGPVGAMSISPGNVVNGSPAMALPYGYNTGHPDPSSGNPLGHNLVSGAVMAPSPGLTQETQTSDYPAAIDKTGIGYTLLWNDNAAYWWSSGDVKVGGHDCWRAGIWLKPMTNATSLALLIISGGTSVTGEGITLAHTEDYITADQGWSHYSTARCGLSEYANIRLRLALRNQTAAQNGAAIKVYNPFLTSDYLAPDSVNGAVMPVPDAVAGRYFADAPYFGRSPIEEPTKVSTLASNQLNANFAGYVFITGNPGSNSIDKIYEVQQYTRVCLLNQSGRPITLNNLFSQTSTVTLQDKQTLCLFNMGVLNSGNGFYSIGGS